MNASPDPADAIRTAAELIKSAQRELAEACAALAAAETHVAAARLPRLVPDAYTMDQVGELHGLSRSRMALMIRDVTIKSVRLEGRDECSAPVWTPTSQQPADRPVRDH